MLYDVFLPEFFKGIVKDLKKKYRSVSEDLKIAFRLVVNNPELGKTIQGFGDVKKLRVRNSDTKKGKRGGYRLITLSTAAGERLCLFSFTANHTKRLLLQKS